jgi:hypothetical protein
MLLLHGDKIMRPQSIECGCARFSFTHFLGKHMKQLLLSGALMVVLLGACGKEPASAPVPPAPLATPAPAPAPAQSSEVAPAPAAAAPGAVMSDEEKMKIVNAAKKKANKGE